MHLFAIKDEYLDDDYYKEKTEADLPLDHMQSIMGKGMFDKAKIMPRHIERIFEISSIREKELKNCSFDVISKL